MIEGKTRDNEEKGKIEGREEKGKVGKEMKSWEKRRRREYGKGWWKGGEE